MNALQHLETDLLVGREEIQGLAADEPVEADGAGNEGSEAR